MLVLSVTICYVVKCKVEMWAVWMVLMLTVCTSISEARDVRVGAFNIQVFGRTKAKKPDVMAILVKIIRRYDLILIQEIRDVSGTSIVTLLNQVNEGQPEPFLMVLSPRLGRSNSKEQYAFLYRPASGLVLQKSYLYTDTKDVFEREPFIVSFTSQLTAMTNFGLAGVHVDPDDAVNEIGNLTRVFQDMKRVLKTTQDYMVMGDLNADCSYVRQSKWSKIGLKSDPLFHWWIGDDVDTTVKRTHCAYDRFISHGNGWSGGIVTGSAGVYRLDEDPVLGLMNETMAAAVSDHYPIEFLVKGKQQPKFHTISVYYVFIEPTTILTSGSLPVQQFYDLQKTDSYFIVYESGVPTWKLRQETKDEDILHQVLTLLNDDGVTFRIKPIKNRYSGKQRSMLYIDIPSAKSHIVDYMSGNICNIFIYLRCKG